MLNISNIVTYLLFTLTFTICKVNADFQGKVLTSNAGCLLSGLSSTQGYSANIYSYSWDDLSDYSDTAFYNGQYTSHLITTAKLVQSPNFIQNLGYSTTASSELWGVEVPITNFVAQLTGYFYGTYISQIIFFFIFFH